MLIKTLIGLSYLTRMCMDVYVCVVAIWQFLLWPNDFLPAIYYQPAVYQKFKYWHLMNTFSAIKFSLLHRPQCNVVYGTLCLHMRFYFFTEYIIKSSINNAAWIIHYNIIQPYVRTALLCSLCDLKYGIPFLWCTFTYCLCTY